MVHAPARMMAPARGPAMGATMQGGAALAVAEDRLTVYATFDHVLDLIRDKRDMTLLLAVERHVRLAKYAPGRIEFEPTADAPSDLAATLSQRLQGWTGARWGVSVVSTGGAATVAETRDADRRAAEAEALQNPLVQAVLANFPGAKITEIRTPEAMAQEAAVQALPEVEDEWDPFEED